MATLPSIRSGAALGLAVFAGAAWAAGPAMTASRSPGRISVDGRLDEPAWSAARVFSDFVESFPNAGTRPSEAFRTEARVLYDDQFLYLGIECLDPEPGKIARQLGRRDSTPTADQVEIAIDSNSDHRTAFDFIVNASGVLRDQLLFNDVNSTDSWDAVWDGAADITPRGWSAEVAIPLRVLRFSAANGRPWGIVIRRVIPRTHQVLDSTLIPRDANPVNTGGLLVSRFGPLEGLTELTPKRDIEFLPYAAARAAVRPQYSDPFRATPRLLDPSLDLGMDFKLALTSNLSLTGTVNPDFGQVEADQVIQNLSTAEPFFPEKRPFFLEGLDIFQPVGAEYGSPQQMFYSRRIGLDSPILGAVKVAGSARPGLDVGFLEAMVMGAGNPSLVPVGYLSPDTATLGPYESAPDRRWQLHWTEPLHFGPNDALPMAHPVTTNYFAGVARQRFGDNSSVGAVFTAATPLEPQCRASEFQSAQDYANAGCTPFGANAGALDWNLRNKSGEWGFFGQAEASEQVGGDPAGRVLRDGTVMHPGDVGYGGHLRAGKLGGEPFRFDVTYVYEDPRLDLNAVGYQPLSNYQWTDLNVHYVRPSGFRNFHNFSVDYNLDWNWSADGTGVRRGINSRAQSQLQLPSFDTIGLASGLEMPQYDTREIQQAGIPFQRLSDVYLSFFYATDPNRRLFASGDVFGYRLFGKGPEPATWGWGWDLSATWRPVNQLETRVDASYGHKPQGARWLETLADDTAVFGYQDPAFLSVTLREQWVITPRLTFQVYAQLFSERIHYGDFYAASLTGQRTISDSQLTPYAYADVNQDVHASALNLNAVLRWEYRLGSTLFLVYSRSQSEQALPSDAPVPPSSLPSGLFQGRAVDTFMIKWSYWWTV